MKRRHAWLTGATLLLSSTAVAQTAPANPNRLTGSDTMNQLLDLLLPNIQERAPEGILNFAGFGSLLGQRQMEGRVLPGEPACSFSGGDNPGCQEIAPMTTQLDSAICDDAESVGQAESLLVARDGIVLLTDNATHQRHSVGACAAAGTTTPNAGAAFTDTGSGHLRASGTLPASGYALGAGMPAGEAWKDTLRLLYTGCRNGDGTCTTSVPRSQRCTNAARNELLTNFGALFEGQACATGNCTRVKHLYRRDDRAGLSAEFLKRIGVNANGFKTRASVLNGGGFPANIGAIPDDFPFCDGGMEEQYNPSSNGSDPIRVPCDADDDLCGADGRSGVLQAIRSSEGFSYPQQQCGRNLFARVPWAITARPVCPDGSAPVGGLCNLPYRLVNGVRDFNCINGANSRPPTLPNVDGRVYNNVQRDSAGNVTFLAAGYPLAASFRQNMVRIDSGFGAVSGKTYAAADVVCQQPDATRNIACLMASSTCSFALDARGGATSGAFNAAQEPVVLDGRVPSNAEILADTYPLSSSLYISAIGGFERINADCEARGHRALPGADDYCYAQYEIAAASYAMPSSLQGAVTAMGYVAIPADYPNRCIGATASAGCGAPTVQVLTACLPTRPPDRDPASP